MVFSVLVLMAWAAPLILPERSFDMALTALPVCISCGCIFSDRSPSDDYICVYVKLTTSLNILSKTTNGSSSEFEVIVVVERSSVSWPILAKIGWEPFTFVANVEKRNRSRYQPRVKWRVGSDKSEKGIKVRTGEEPMEICNSLSTSRLLKLSWSRHVDASYSYQGCFRCSLESNTTTEYPGTCAEAVGTVSSVPR